MRRRMLLCSLLALVGASSAAGATFPADPSSLGSIPDAPGTADCGTFGAARDVTFTASGLQNHITNIEVTVQFNPLHPWAGDFDVVLIAPNAVKHSIFSRTSVTTADGCGDGSDLVGPYTFSDLAGSPPHGGWWQAATVASPIEPIASGTYRTPAPGGAGAVNPSPSKLMTPAFTSSNPNGVWRLRIRDGGAGDTGSSVSAASLTITAEHTDPPQTSFVKKPPKRTTSRRAVFRFKSSQTPATFECKLGRKAYRPCTSPKTYTKLALGWHTVRVRASALGNRDATPATYTWRVVRG